jgi:hypothetical protein
MTRKLKLVPALFFILFAMNSCTKEVSFTNTSADLNSSKGLKDIKVEDDLFAFEDINHFVTSMQELTAMKPDKLNEWYKSQKVVSLQSEYNDMLKAYELLTDEKDKSRVDDFRKKYSDIAIFDEDGTVSINTSLKFAPIVNKKGLFKIDKSLIVSNAEKSVQILDGDRLKIQEALRSSEKQDTNFNVQVEKSQPLATRGTCQGQQNATIDIYNNSIGLRETPNGSFKWLAESKLSISNWSYIQPDGSLFHFVALIANTKSYKRGFFGGWYSTSQTKHCHGRAKVANAGIFQAQACILNKKKCVDADFSQIDLSASEVTYYIVGPYSYYTHYLGNLGTFAGTFGESCSDLTMINYFPSGFPQSNIRETIQ